MGMRTRLFAAAAAVVLASTGLAVVMAPSPASAATATCTMKAVTNTSTYVRAENYGYGQYGTCYRVQARAQQDWGSGFTPWVYGPVHSSVSQYEKGSSNGLINRGTQARPVSSGPWSGYAGANGTLHRTVTI